MGGELWVDSEYGKGSRFFFSTKARVASWSLENVRQKVSVSFPGRRILFIDTVRANNGVMEAVEQIGLDIIVVHSIEEACLQQAGSGVFDTVLVSEVSVVEDLRDIEHLRYIPLVLVSPSIGTLNLKHCLDCALWPWYLPWKCVD
jgi:osomolarity two-component system, sensor histidine kinase NIK1